MKNSAPLLRSPLSRLLATLALLLAAAMLLAACGGAASAPQSAGPAPAKPSGAAAPASAGAAASAAPIKMRVRYPVVTPAWLPWVIAKDSKLFEKYGLDVDLDQLVPDQMMQAAISNQIEIGGLPPESIMNADTRGAQAVMVGSFIQKAIGRVTTVPGITKIEDLKGKTAVVTGLGSIEDTSFKRLLGRANLDPEKDLSFVVVKDIPAELAAVKAGQAQAYLAIPPGDLLGERAGLHVIFDVETLNLPYIQASIFTTKSYVDKNRPAILALMQATTEGLARMKSDPDYALSTFIKYSKIEDKEIAQRGVQWAVNTLGRVPLVNQESLKAVQDNVVKTNPAAANLAFNTYADTSFTDEIAKSGLVDKLYKS